MGWRNLSSYIAALDASGDLLRIAHPVDLKFEAGCAADLLVKAGGPAVLFEQPILNDGSISEFPLAMNLFGTTDRVKRALNVTNPGEVGERMVDLMKPDISAISRRPWRGLPLAKAGFSMAPKRIRRAPCQQVRISNPDVTKLPIPTTWPLDGGPFVTLPLVVTKDANSGVHNLGMYRSQVYGPKLMGLHWQTHKHGADHAENLSEGKMPIAICIGGPPELIFSAIAPLPDNLSEFEFAGFLQHRRLRLVKAVSQDLLVPAECDIIIEGYCNIGEMRREGPFGDHFGHYSMEDDYPVMHVTAITHRKNAIAPMTIVGKPPMEDGYLGEAIGDAFLPILKFQHRDVIDLFLPLETGFHNLGVVASKQRYPRQARKTALGLWGAGQLMFLKTIVTVDAAHPVKDLDALLDALDTKVVIDRDLVVLDGMVADTLAHAAPWDNIHSKLLIDATTPAAGDSDRRLPILGVESDLIKSIAGLDGVTEVSQLRPAILVVTTDYSSGPETMQLIKSIWQLKNSANLRWLILTDDDIDLKVDGARRDLLWRVFCRFEVSRDLHFDSDGSRLAWDATTPIANPDVHPPIRHWPEVLEHSPEIIEKVEGWLEWE